MARPVRLNYSNTFYHVLSRGNERRRIFRDRRDYRKFIELLGEMSEKFRIDVHAFVLMPNHYHLLVQTQEPNLSMAIQWLGVSYSTWFNKRHNRNGHVFQGRFKSFIVENDRYMAALCIYIHRNPVRSGLSKSLSKYPWSSYHAYVGRDDKLPWLKRSLILGVFENSKKEFVMAHSEFINKEEKIFDYLRYGLFFGSEDFAARFKDDLKKEIDREKPQARRALISKDISEATRLIFEKLGITDMELIESMKKPLRKASRPMRDLVIYILSRLGIFTHNVIGHEFGVGYTSVTGSIKRAKMRLERDKELGRKVEEILNDI